MSASTFSEWETSGSNCPLSAASRGTQYRRADVLLPVRLAGDAFIKGKSTQITKGAMLTAFADQDTVIELPLLPLPPDV